MNYCLTSFLQTIEDFRRAQGQRYPLDKVLLMIIMSIINGASGYREMARFMKHHESKLEELLELKHGVPSHVSVREIILGIDLQAFNKAFMKWMKTELEKPEKQWVSIDGKAIRSTIKSPKNKLKDFVQVVSIFTHNSDLVIGQNSFMNKKGIEPQRVRELIKQLDKRGLYICLDALHCKKKTLGIIRRTGNHFLIQVKANTPMLLDHIQKICDSNPMLDSSITIQRSNGRTDHRVTEVYEVFFDQLPPDWKGIQRVVKHCRFDSESTEQKRKDRKSWGKNNKPTNGIHYYIVSDQIDQADKLASIIRNHWKIENGLHWKKDVYLNEDGMTIWDKSAAALVAAFNNIVLNQIRKANIKPNKDFFTQIKNNIQWIYQIVRT